MRMRRPLSSHWIHGAYASSSRSLNSFQMKVCGAQSRLSDKRAREGGGGKLGPQLTVTFSGGRRSVLLVDSADTCGSPQDGLLTTCRLRSGGPVSHPGVCVDGGEGLGVHPNGASPAVVCDRQTSRGGSCGSRGGIFGSKCDGSRKIRRPSISRDPCWNAARPDETRAGETGRPAPPHWRVGLRGSSAGLGNGGSAGLECGSGAGISTTFVPSLVPVGHPCARVDGLENAGLGFGHKSKGSPKSVSGKGGDSVTARAEGPR